MSEYDIPVLGDDPDPVPPESAEAAPATKATPNEGPRQTQWDIVRRQFRKNRGAVWGLRVAVLLVLTAVYAPVMASAQPFVYGEPDGTWSFPWFATLLDASVWVHALDRIFNLAMIAVSLYFVGRLLMRVSGRTLKGWGKLVTIAAIGFGIAHLLFDIGAPKSPAKDYRVALDAVKSAEDALLAAPIADEVKASIGPVREDYGGLYALADSAAKRLSKQGSRAASKIRRPLGDATQTLAAEQGQVDFALQRIARNAGLLATDDFEGGSDATVVDPKLREAWDEVVASQRAQDQATPRRVDPASIVKTLRERLSMLGGPTAEQMRFAVNALADNLDRVVVETADRLAAQMERAELPTEAEAKESLVKATAERDEYFILMPPVPYGYREQLPQAYDRFRSYFDFARGERHMLGTDETGRDVFARILFGTRISLTIGIFAVSIYVTIGTILGALAGYFRGWIDLFIMRAVEILICIPGLFLILTIVALFGERSIWLLMFAIGIVSWTGITRLVRGEFLRERNAEYVLAAQAMGYSTPRIIFRHVLPNSIGPVLVAATFGIASAILTESGLSFLGLGDVSVPSWGGILNAGRTNEMWHMIIPPAVAIFITVTALNLVGDGVRDALDPKLRN